MMEQPHRGGLLVAQGGAGGSSSPIGVACLFHGK